MRAEINYVHLAAGADCSPAPRLLVKLFWKRFSDTAKKETFNEKALKHLVVEVVQGNEDNGISDYDDEQSDGGVSDNVNEGNNDDNSQEVQISDILCTI